MSRWQDKRINEGCHCCSCTCAWRHLRQVHANLTRHEAAALVTTFRRGHADVTWMVDANLLCARCCASLCQSTLSTCVYFLGPSVTKCCSQRWWRVMWHQGSQPMGPPSTPTVRQSAHTHTHTQCSLPAGFQAQKMGSPRARPLTIWASSAELRVNAPKNSMWHTVCVSQCRCQFWIW